MYIRNTNYTENHKQYSISVLTIILLLIFVYPGFTQQIDTNSAKLNSSEFFEIQKEYKNWGKTYQVGRIQFKNYTYGKFTLRIIDQLQNVKEIYAPVDYPADLQTSRSYLIELNKHPFFFVADRYHAHLIHIKQEKIYPAIIPGQQVNYAQDAISQTIGGFHFLDNKYFLGGAVNYGPFCFNITNLDHPTELKRYSSCSSDYGQPYFFLEKNKDGTYNGLISHSGKSKQSSFESVFYTEKIKASYLFKNAKLAPYEEAHYDPADYENGQTQPYLLLHEINKKLKSNLQQSKHTPWIIDLKKGVLLKGKQAYQFLKDNKVLY